MNGARVAVIFAVGLLVGVVAVTAWQRGSHAGLRAEPVVAAPVSLTSDVASVAPKPTIRQTDTEVGLYPTVDQLMALTDSELERVDPLVINLAVARGIPQFGSLDVGHCVETLDAWAAEIGHDVERHLYRFEQDPEQFGHSEAEYRITWLCSDINAVFQVDYDIRDLDFSEPANLFLNGIVERKLGTCVSMPLLHVALGWRLGYPIKLVPVPTHLFARWDDGQTRINIEATGYGAELPDESYEKEYFTSARCKERGGELASLTPRQTLAVALLARASYWKAVGEVDRHVADALRANLLFPEYPVAIAELAGAWQARDAADDYYQHAYRHLTEAVRRIDDRVRAHAEEPVEKLIFTDTGPTRVLVDPQTGAQRPITEPEGVD